MNGFTESTKEAYEVYAQGKVKEALNQLDQKSFHYGYIQLIEELKAGKGKVTKSFTKKFEDFIEKHPHDTERFQPLIDKLVQMDEIHLLRKLVNNQHGLSFTHQKPYYAQNMGKKAENALGPSKWNQEEHFCEQKLIEAVESNPCSINSCLNLFT
ncbi:unnamed protein product [Moneuplotes crassus]|uniref:Uncharacterized protein n=1 Tax=Euplotes crassus TaxID=5936 RepID=A0AAD1Y3Z9_EUPCR|nr:unnamed protein product [Moneuplotes crassus]